MSTSSTPTRAPGFTLTELLVVIALIGILATTVGVALTGGTGRALKAAQSQVISAINVARISGIKGGALYPGEDTSSTIPVAALIININPNSDGYLRQFGVVAGRCNSNYSNFKWRAVGSPMMLPEGIFFVPSNQAGRVDADSDIQTSSSRASLDLTYPYFKTYTGGVGTDIGGNTQGLTAEPFYCLFYGNDGALIWSSDSGTPASPNTTASQNLIIAAGQRVPNESGTSFTVTFSNGAPATGVRAIRYGSAIPINDPDDLSR